MSGEVVPGELPRRAEAVHFLSFLYVFSHVAGKYCKCSRAQRVGKCSRGLTSLEFAAWTHSTWQGSGFDGGAGTAEVAFGA